MTVWDLLSQSRLREIESDDLYNFYKKCILILTYNVEPTEHSYKRDFYLSNIPQFTDYPIGLADPCPSAVIIWILMRNSFNIDNRHQPLFTNKFLLRLMVEPDTKMAVLAWLANHYFISPRNGRKKRIVYYRNPKYNTFAKILRSNRKINQYDTYIFGKKDHVLDHVESHIIYDDVMNVKLTSYGTTSDGYPSHLPPDTYKVIQKLYYDQRPLIMCRKINMRMVLEQLDADKIKKVTNHYKLIYIYSLQPPKVQIRSFKRLMPAIKLSKPYQFPQFSRMNDLPF